MRKHRNPASALAAAGALLVSALAATSGHAQTYKSQPVHTFDPGVRNVLARLNVKKGGLTNVHILNKNHQIVRTIQLDLTKIKSVRANATNRLQLQLIKNPRPLIGRLAKATRRRSSRVVGPHPDVVSSDGDPLLTSSIEQYETSVGNTFDPEWYFPTIGYDTANNPASLYLLPSSADPTASNADFLNFVFATYLKTGGNPDFSTTPPTNAGVAISELDVAGSVYDESSKTYPGGTIEIDIYDGVSADDSLASATLATTTGGNSASYSYVIPSGTAFAVQPFIFPTGDLPILQATDPATGEVGNCAIVIELVPPATGSNSTTAAWFSFIGASNGATVQDEEIGNAIPNPTLTNTTATAAAVAGGTIPAHAYKVTFTYYNGTGETTDLLPTKSVTTTAADASIAVTFTADPDQIADGAAGVNLYVGQTATALHKQATTLSVVGGDLVATAKAYNATSAAPPATNTTTNSFTPLGLVTGGATDGSVAGFPAFNSNPSDNQSTSADEYIAPINPFMQLAGLAADGVTAISRGTLIGNYRRQGVFIPGTGASPENYPGIYTFSFFQTGTANLVMTQTFIAQPSYDSTGALTTNYIIDGIPAGTYDIMIQDQPVYYFSDTSTNGTGQQSESLWVNTQTELQYLTATGALNDWFTPYPYSDWFADNVTGIVIAAGTPTTTFTTLNGRLTRFGDIADHTGTSTGSGDGVVDLADFSALAASFGLSTGQAGFFAPADLVSQLTTPIGSPDSTLSPTQLFDDPPDGVVDASDFNALAIVFSTGTEEVP